MIEQLILDVKGVLYNDTQQGKELTPGAQSFVRYLTKNAIPFLLATNITSQMPQDVLQELKQLGFCVSLDRLTSCVDLSLQYLTDDRQQRVFLISDNKKLRQFYRENGVVVIELEDRQPCDAVVVALDKRVFSDEEYAGRIKAEALHYLANGARLVALHRNMVRIDDHGRQQPNVGQLVTELEESSHYDKTVVIGKPSETFYRQALKKLPTQEPSVTLAVGDDLVGDLSGAYKLGMPTALFFGPKASFTPSSLKFTPTYELMFLMELMNLLEINRSGS